MPNYRKMFLDDPKAFFERYSINLPGNPQEAGKIGGVELARGFAKPIAQTEENKGEFDMTGSSADKSFFKFQSKSGAWSVSALSHNAAWKVDEEQKKATLIVRTAPAADTRTEEETASMKWFLCLMLPWVQNGVTTMQLRKNARADVFFTGQMNGCSFVVTGDPEEPYVSHINCDLQNEYRAKYRDVLRNRPTGVDKSNAVRLGRTDYKLGTTGRRRYEDDLKDNLSDNKEKLVGDIITDTLCFVMGRRVNQKWEFFYQRVITQQFTSIKRLGRGGGMTKFFGRDNREAHQTIVYRAISPYNRLWPDGVGRLST